MPELTASERASITSRASRAHTKEHRMRITPQVWATLLKLAARRTLDTDQFVTPQEVLREGVETMIEDTWLREIV